MSYKDAIKKVQEESRELFDKRSPEYNNTFEKFGPIGVVLGISSKIADLINVTNNNISLASDKKLREILIDLNNYSAMGIILIDECSKTHPVLNNESIENNSIDTDLYQHSSY